MVAGGVGEVDFCDEFAGLVGAVGDGWGCFWFFGEDGVDVGEGFLEGGGGDFGGEGFAADAVVDFVAVCGGADFEEGLDFSFGFEGDADSFGGAGVFGHFLLLSV